MEYNLSGRKRELQRSYLLQGKGAVIRDCNDTAQEIFKMFKNVSSLALMNVLLASIKKELQLNRERNDHGPLEGQ